MNCFALCAWALCNLLSFNTILYGHVIFNFWSLGNRRQKPQKRPFIHPKKSHCFPPNLILEATPKICTLVRFAPQSLVTLSPSHDFFYGQSTPAIQMYSHTPTLSPSTPCPPRSRHSGACPPVETDLVWLPTLEMMDWWLTYVKVQGGSSGKQAQSCIKYGVGWREKETGLWFIQCALKLEV